MVTGAVRQAQGELWGGEDGTAGWAGSGSWGSRLLSDLFLFWWHTNASAILAAGEWWGCLASPTEQHRGGMLVIGRLQRLSKERNQADVNTWTKCLSIEVD